MTSPATEPAASPVPAPLALTGERTLPDVPDERYWFARHLVAYHHAAAGIARRAAAGPAPAVLDAGCGEGYGVAMLAAAGAATVLGVDIEPGVVAHARHAYPAPDGRIRFAVADLSSLPLADAAVDVTVSFQVIEHLDDVAGYLASLRRVTAPGGRILIATPNRLTFTPDSDVPVNPFHTREFTADELVVELCDAGLEVTSVLGVHHGGRLRTVEFERGVDLPVLLTASAPEQWDTSLRRMVHGVHAEDFVIRGGDVAASLDLLVTCRTPDRAVPAQTSRRRMSTTAASENTTT